MNHLQVVSLARVVICWHVLGIIVSHGDMFSLSSYSLFSAEKLKTM